MLAEAEAEKAARVGIAQALAIDEQVRAYGGPQLQLARQVMDRFSEAIETAKVDVVPRVMIQNGAGAGAGGTTGNAFEALFALLLSDRLETGAGGKPAPRDARIQAIRDELVHAVDAEGSGPVAKRGA
jgi:hypothetical protein